MNIQKMKFHGTIYVISYGGYDAPDDIDTFETQHDFFEFYKKLSDQERDSIRYIIVGKEMKVGVQEIEVVKKWKLEANNG